MRTPDLVTTPKTAQILGCSTHTVYRLVNRGVLKPAMRLDTGPNGAYLFDLRDVERVAKTREGTAA